MSKVAEAVRELGMIGSSTQRALEMAGLISTVFKLHGVELIVTGAMAYSSYADTGSPDATLELAPFAGKLTPRLLQEVMGGELRAEGSLGRWKLAGISIWFHFESSLALRNLCRDFTTSYGMVKLWPAEELTAERIVAAVFPERNAVARGEALTLLTQALVDAFQMDWIALRELCDGPAYRVGEELADLRTEAKRGADALGLGRDQIGSVWSAETRPRDGLAVSVG